MLLAMNEGKEVTMRCKSCGGHLHHLVTTVDGKQLRQCRTGLTVSGASDPRNPADRNIIGIRTCGLVHNDRGSLVSGKYVYYAYHKDTRVPEAITIREGIIQ